LEESVKGSGSSEITRAEARAALIRSGYLLESRAEARLQDAGYYVEANHTYPDPDTGKSREFDLYAMSAVRAGPRSGRDFVFPVLLMECVNNPHPFVLITKEPQVPFLHHEDIKHAGLPVKFPAKDSGWRSLPDYLNLAKVHHYCKGRIATQFCSFRRKKDQQQAEWMALHEDAQFDCFRKLCAVTDYFLAEHFKGWRYGGPEFVNIEFYYPILVVGGELLEAQPSSKSVRLTRRQHLQFRRSHIVRGEAKNYQIDVITESFLSKYLELVQQETEVIARRLRRRHKEVRASLERIVQVARTLRSPAKIREALEF
jgi:hypothetical protein